MTALAAGLVVVVALSSRPAIFASEAAPARPSMVVIALEVILYLAVLMGIAALALLVWVFWPERRRKRLEERDESQLVIEPREDPWWVKLLAMMVPFVVLIGMIALLRNLLSGQETLEGVAGAQPILAPGAVSGGPAPPEAAATALPSPLIALGIVVLLMLVLITVVAWVLVRDRRRTFAPGIARQGPLTRAVDVSLEALLREPDPRRAVIAAYAAMERSLSRSGLGRRPYEAPIEYLRRVLDASTAVTDELRTITHLFQLAMFSRHAVDEPMRRQAIGALERIRSATGPAAG